MANKSKLTPINGSSKITADTPLTPVQQKFVIGYIQHGDAIRALNEAGVTKGTRAKDSDAARRFLDAPNVRAEINRVMEELRNETIATAKEVMSYFTKVMRGEEKDQFGLEAPLSERTKAAQELAKRTIDIENRASGKADERIEIKLDWSR